MIKEKIEWDVGISIAWKYETHKNISYLDIVLFSFFFHIYALIFASFCQITFYNPLYLWKTLNLIDI